MNSAEIDLWLAALRLGWLNMYKVFADTKFPPEHQWLVLPLLRAHGERVTLTATEIHREARAARGPLKSRPQIQTILIRLEDRGYVVNDTGKERGHGKWRLSPHFIRALGAAVDDGS